MWDYLKQLYDTQLAQRRLAEHERRCAVPTIRTIRRSIEERELDTERPYTGMVSGVVVDSVTGTGAQVEVDIDAGSAHRSWVYYNVYSVVADVQQPDRNYQVWGDDPGGGGVLIRYWQLSQLHDTYSSGRIPLSQLLLRVPGSALATEYVIVGIWLEDR